MTIGADVPGKRPAVLEVFEAGGAVGRDLARRRLGGHAARPAASSWPQSLAAVVRVLLTVALLDVDGVGPGADVLLQRRLPARHARQASTRGRSAGRRARSGRRSGPTSARASSA